MAEQGNTAIVLRYVHYGRLVAGQIGYNLRLLGRSPRSLVAGVLLPAVVLIMHGPGAAGGSHARLVAGLAVLGAVSTSYVTHANGLVTAREAGVLRRWQLNPLPPACFFAGKIVATVLLADASALFTVLAASLMGATTAPLAAAYLLVPITVGALVWASISTAITPFIPNTASAYPLLTVTYLPVVLVSGAIGRISGEPSWAAALTRFLPVRPVLDAVVDTLQQPGPASFMSLQGLAVLSAWTLLALVVALLRFRWAPRHAR